MRGAGAARRGLGQAPRALSAERQAVGALLFPPIGGSRGSGASDPVKTAVVCSGAPGPLARERIAARCGQSGRFHERPPVCRGKLRHWPMVCFLKARGCGKRPKSFGRAPRDSGRSVGAARVRFAAAPLRRFLDSRLSAARAGPARRRGRKPVARGGAGRCGAGAFCPTAAAFLFLSAASLRPPPGPARAREGVREGTRGDVARAKRNERPLRLRPLSFRVSRGHWAWGRRVAVWVVRGPKCISPIVKFAPIDGAKAGGALKWVCGETERQR